jgi:hypothetical protein
MAEIYHRLAIELPLLDPTLGGGGPEGEEGYDEDELVPLNLVTPLRWGRGDERGEEGGDESERGEKERLSGSRPLEEERGCRTANQFCCCCSSSLHCCHPCFFMTLAGSSTPARGCPRSAP